MKDPFRTPPVQDSERVLQDSEEKEPRPGNCGERTPQIRGASRRVLTPKRGVFWQCAVWNQAR